MFSEIGYSDVLGSGTVNIKRFVKLYSNSEPIFEDGDIFRTIIPIFPTRLTDQKLKLVTTNSSEKNKNSKDSLQQKNDENIKKTEFLTKETNFNNIVPDENLIDFIKFKISSNNKITREQIAASANVSVKK